MVNVTTEKQKQERKLVAELVAIERRSEYLATRLDEVTLEIRDIEEKRKAVARRKEAIIKELGRLGVKI
jgi:hypothetical protein